MEIDLNGWVSMPKVELHAHLNGSVRNSTLLELARELGEKGIIVFSDVEHVILKNDRSLTEVFKLFDLIHILTTDHATVTRITKEEKLAEIVVLSIVCSSCGTCLAAGLKVVEDFAAENVVYLELRTTPKRNDAGGMTKRSYMEAVVEGLKRVDAIDIDFASTDVALEKKWKSCHTNNECHGISSSSRKMIYVRLLLSIDRRETLEAAMETVKLALEMKNVGVVGIDLSGNPKVGNWTTFLPALRFAREQGLHVTLHCGEVPNQEEIHGMLDFLPERIGHACCLEEDAWRKLIMSKIPVEICLTSNIRTNTISSIDVHHFADLYNMKHPLILCTDDTGVFSTSLSNEYAIAAATFGLGKTEIFEVARKAVEFSFADKQVVRKLKGFFDAVEENF